MSAFEQTPPALSTDELQHLARLHYALDGQATNLASERDQNACIAADGQKYVLKISNAAEDLGQIDLQNAVLRHLGDAGVTGVPCLVPTTAGQDGAFVQVDGKSCAVRLVTWVDGALFSQAPRSLTQLANLGRFVGRLTRGLQGFGHPAAHRDEFIWSLDRVGDLRPFVDEIADQNGRMQIAALFDRYDQCIHPMLPKLRASALHHDANDNNIIVDADDPDHIAGLIDFGDMCHGRTINELAVTLAYALLDAPDLYGAARAVISGYVAEFPIEETEADALYDLMRMRLAASICISSHQARLHPDNSYLTISQAPALNLLNRLDGIDPEFMRVHFRNAAGYTPIRTEPAVRAYLESTTPKALFRPDLHVSARIALLTDSADPGMPRFSDPAFDHWFASKRPAGLPANVGFYGLGSYGEARSVYTSDHFADSASAERRTRHLGIDVFVAAGTPVYAPLDGKVASVSYNADPLDYGHTLILEHETPGGDKFWSLYGHLGATLPKLLTAGQTVAAGDLIAHLGGWQENGGWAPHLHFQVMTSMLSQTGNFFGVGHDSLWDVWSGICINPNLILRLAPESFNIDPNPPEMLLRRRATSIGPSLSVSYAEKLKIVRGEGAWLLDHTGRAFLDAVNNITHVGHCHPHVVAAITRQASVLNTNTRYLNELMLDYSDRLTAKLPGGLKVAYFVNSGTEANELALRIARTAIGRKNTVVLDWAYHG
ncbi:MAG: aminotransferase class III-fold pyridoxal phosphate-dependent enzyme, partial [Albidovulum sp.]